MKSRAFMFLAFLVAGCMVGSWFMPLPTQAYVGPRPTVELVKVFSCNLLRWTSDHCAPDVESQANDWLQKQQPGIRIVSRMFAASRDGLFLAIFYEVPDWRVKPAPQQKLPAEAQPK